MQPAKVAWGSSRHGKAKMNPLLHQMVARTIIDDRMGRAAERRARSRWSTGRFDQVVLPGTPDAVGRLDDHRSALS